MENRGGERILSIAEGGEERGLSIAEEGEGRDNKYCIGRQGEGGRKFINRILWILVQRRNGIGVNVVHVLSKCVLLYCF